MRLNSLQSSPFVPDRKRGYSDDEMRAARFKWIYGINFGCFRQSQNIHTQHTGRGRRDDSGEKCRAEQKMIFTYSNKEFSEVEPDLMNFISRLYSVFDALGSYSRNCWGLNCCLLLILLRPHLSLSGVLFKCKIIFKNSFSRQAASARQQRRKKSSQQQKKTQHTQHRRRRVLRKRVQVNAVWINHSHSFISTLLLLCFWFLLLFLYIYFISFLHFFGCCCTATSSGEMLCVPHSKMRRGPGVCWLGLAAFGSTVCTYIFQFSTYIFGLVKDLEREKAFEMIFHST